VKEVVAESYRIRGDASTEASELLFPDQAMLFF